MSRKSHEKCERITDSLFANSQAYHEGSLTHSRFHSRQSGLWGIAHDLGMEDEVREMIRVRMALQEKKGD